MVMLVSTVMWYYHESIDRVQRIVFSSFVYFVLSMPFFGFCLYRMSTLDLPSLFYETEKFFQAFSHTYDGKNTRTKLIITSLLGLFVFIVLGSVFLPFFFDVSTYPWIGYFLFYPVILESCVAMLLVKFPVNRVIDAESDDERA